MIKDYRKEMNNETDKQLNFERYKEDSEAYQKIKVKIVRALDTQVLINELKRRKIIHINWDTMKYDKTDLEGEK